MNKRLMIWAVSLVALLLAACETQATNNDKNNKKENKMKTIELTKADFLKKVMDYETNPNEWKYLGDKPAIIDFYASWCGPCKMVAPILEELAEEYDGQIYIYKVNTEEEQELAGLFGISRTGTAREVSLFHLHGFYRCRGDEYRLLRRDRYKKKIGGPGIGWIYPMITN